MRIGVFLASTGCFSGRRSPTRLAAPHKNGCSIEINGELGSLRFDFDHMNVLELYDASDPPREGGWRRIACTSAGAHPYVESWWPEGHWLGYEHGFVNQTADMMRALAGQPTELPLADFSDGYEVAPESNATVAAPAGSPLDRDRIREYRESLRPAMEGKEVKGSADTHFHIRNFLDCIKSREKPNCDIESAHRSTTLANIGNIAHKTRQHLEWDRDAEQFTNSDEANRYLHYEYRAPWKLG